MFTRRQLLGGILGSSTLAVSTSPGVDPPAEVAPGLSSPSVPPFRSPLFIPPVLAPVSSDESGDRYEITMTETQAEIIPGTLTTLWAYNGLYPGPTIKARSGRPV